MNYLLLKFHCQTSCILYHTSNQDSTPFLLPLQYTHRPSILPLASCNKIHLMAKISLVFVLLSARYVYFFVAIIHICDTPYVLCLMPLCVWCIGHDCWSINMPILRAIVILSIAQRCVYSYLHDWSRHWVSSHASLTSSTYLLYSIRRHYVNLDVIDALLVVE